MAKCLIIRNANFSANKVTTIEFDDIPCTGIALSEDTLTFTSLTAVELEATLTPSDTTDDVLWSSSDESVATVSGGTVTPTGLGECTITATCGSYSDTCAVTVAIVESPFLALASNGTTFTSDNKTYLVLTGSNRVGCVCLLSESSFTNMMTIYNKSSAFQHGDVTAIQIPLNADSIRVKAKSQYSGSDSSIWFLDANDGAISTGANYGLRVIDSHFFTVSSGNINESVSIPEGANSYAVFLRASSSSIFSNVDSEEDMQDIFDDTFEAEITYETSSDEET